MKLSHMLKINKVGTCNGIFVALHCYYIESKAIPNMDKDRKMESNFNPSYESPNKIVISAGRMPLTVPICVL